MKLASKRKPTKHITMKDRHNVKEKYSILINTQIRFEDDEEEEEHKG
jgi:hypothetical protein